MEHDMETGFYRGCVVSGRMDMCGPKSSEEGLPRVTYIPTKEGVGPTGVFFLVSLPS